MKYLSRQLQYFARTLRGEIHLNAQRPTAMRRTGCHASPGTAQVQAAPTGTLFLFRVPAQHHRQHFLNSQAKTCAYFSVPSSPIPCHSNERRMQCQYTHRERFNAVRLPVEAVSSVSIGSMLSFLLPTRLSEMLIILNRLISSSSSKDAKNSPISVAATPWNDEHV